MLIKAEDATKGAVIVDVVDVVILGAAVTVTPPFRSAIVTVETTTPSALTNPSDLPPGADGLFVTSNT